MSTLNKSVGWTESEGNPTMPVSGLFDGSEKLIIFLSLYHFHRRISPTRFVLFSLFSMQTAGHTVVLLGMRRFMH